MMNLKLHAKFIAKEQELHGVAREILELERNIIVLCGEVGSGKTTLVKALVAVINKANNIRLDAINDESKNARSDDMKLDSNDIKLDEINTHNAFASSAPSITPHATNTHTTHSISPTQNTSHTSTARSTSSMQRAHTPCVTSPTFSLLHEYNGVYHYDLYRKNAAQILELGLLDLLSEDGIHCIEWGEELLALLIDAGFSCMCVRITHSAHARIYELYI